jgi:hypothetical protein
MRLTEEREVPLVQGRAQVTAGTIRGAYEWSQVRFTIRGHEPEPSSASQNPMTLLEVSPRVGNMLKEILLNQDIKRFIWKGLFLERSMRDVKSIARSRIVDGKG